MNKTEPDPRPDVSLRTARCVVRYWVCPECHAVNHTSVRNDWDDCQACGLRVGVVEA